MQAQRSASVAAVVTGFRIQACISSLSSLTGTGALYTPLTHVTRRSHLAFISSSSSRFWQQVKHGQRHEFIKEQHAMHPPHGLGRGPGR